MELSKELAQMRDTMPPVFAGTALNGLTGNAYNWRTLQNEKSRGEVPENVFMRAGVRKLLICRDNFLIFWQRKLNASKRAS